MDTYEVVQEEAVVESKTRVVERERPALVRCSRNDDLGDALVFELGVYIGSVREFNVSRAREWTFYLLVETVE